MCFPVAAVLLFLRLEKKRGWGWGWGTWFGSCLDLLVKAAREWREGQSQLEPRMMAEEAKATVNRWEPMKSVLAVSSSLTSNSEETCSHLECMCFCLASKQQYVRSGCGGGSPTIWTCTWGWRETQLDLWCDWWTVIREKWQLRK